MKSLLPILIGTLLLLSTPLVGNNRMENKAAPSDGQALIHYAYQIKGVWQEIGSTDEAGFSLKISPEYIKGDILKVSISDYFIPGFVQYLHFKYENKRLKYAGASM